VKLHDISSLEDGVNEKLLNILTIVLRDTLLSEEKASIEIHFIKILKSYYHRFNSKKNL